MPIYEFYCRDCHTIFSFYSARINTAARPVCPRCQKVELERKPSTFATLRHGGKDEPDPLAALDDPRLAGAMESLMGEMGDGADEQDPRAIGQFMRRFSDLAGLQMGEQLEDLVRRLEAGEDPDRLEQELGDGPEDDDEALRELFKLKQAALSHRRPRVDETLYFL